MHWVGSDIMEMKIFQQQGFKFCPYLLKKAVHWVEVSWTGEELAELGIMGKIVPLTPTNFPAAILDFPEKFTALTYLPTGNSQFYGESQIVELAKKFPAIVFLVVAASATDRKPDWPANLIPVGWVDNMAEIYREVMVLIRLPQHDGLSFMVLEALANGRHVIWNYPLTGVMQTTGFGQTAVTLAEIYQDFCQGRLTVNQTGRDFVIEHYNPEIVWQRINQGINEVLQQ